MLHIRAMINFDHKNTESCIGTTNKRFPKVFLKKIDYTKNLFTVLREDSQIDLSMCNIKWGWRVLRVDVIDLKSIFSRRH